MKRFAKLSQAKEAYEIDAAWLPEPWCNWGTLADNGQVTPYEFLPVFGPGNREEVQIDPDKAGLFERIHKLEELLARAPTKPEPTKWEPVGGEFYIVSDGRIATGSTSERFRLFGTERKTKEQAEKARDKMRVFNRLLAYHDEFCPDYEFISGCDNHYVYSYKGIFKVDSTCGTHVLNTIYFPEQIANELCKKLNSGEVVL